MLNNEGYFPNGTTVPKSKEEMQWAIDNDYIIPAFKDAEKITVDMLLDHVDVRLDWYTPSTEAFEFFNFIRLSLGEEPENSNPPSHYFLVDCVFRHDTVEPYFKVRNINYQELNDRIVVLCTREWAKALDENTLIATPNGNIKIKDIKQNDYVISRTGKPTKVIAKSKKFMKDTYKIKLEDGREIISSEDHEHILWKRKSTIKLGHRINGLEEVVLTSKDLFEKGVTTKRTITKKQKRGYENKYYIPRLYSAIEYNEVDIQIDPYTIGVILGDGSISKGCELKQTDRAIKRRKTSKFNYVDNNDKSYNRGYTRLTLNAKDTDEILSNIPYKYKIKTYKNKPSSVTVTLDSKLNKSIADVIGVDRSYTKKIPKQLLIGSIEQRLSVLRGLMDTDGTITKEGIPSFTTVSIQLANDVKNIIQSLGGRAIIKEKQTNSNFGIAYEVQISLNWYSLFTLKRKKAREKYARNRDCFPIKSIEKIETRPSYCLTVECDTKSFVLANGLITHNSTILGTYMNIYFGAKGKTQKLGKINYGLYVGDSMENNVKTTMLTIRSVINESLNLKNMFEDINVNADRLKLIRHPSTKKEVELYNHYVKELKIDPKEIPGRMKRTFALRGVGANSGVRGSRDSLTRPKFAMIDDVVKSEKDASSDTILEAIDSTIDADVLSGLDTQNNFAVLIGTPYNKKDPVYKRIELGSWLPIVFPKAEDIRLDLKKEEFRGVWEDRHTYEACMRDYKRAYKAKQNGDPLPMKKLMQEFYLRINSEEDRLIQPNWIQYFDREDILKNAFAYNWYITTDFTTTGSKGSDYSAMMLWALGSEGDWFLIDLVVRKMDLEEQYENVFDLVKTVYTRARGVEVGVEVDGQQRAHIFALKQMMPKKGIYFTFARQKGAKIGNEGISSRKEGGNKHWRFRMIVPYFQNRKIWFAEQLKKTRKKDFEEMITELEYANTNGFGSQHDDALDCISMINMMETITPPKQELDIDEKGNKQLDYNWYKDPYSYQESESTAYDSYA